MKFLALRQCAAYAVAEVVVPGPAPKQAPFTPWFMRRNEIWLHLAPAR